MFLFFLLFFLRANSQTCLKRFVLVFLRIAFIVFYKDHEASVCQTSRACTPTPLKVLKNMNVLQSKYSSALQNYCLLWTAVLLKGHNTSRSVRCERSLNMTKLKKRRRSKRSLRCSVRGEQEPLASRLVSMLEASLKAWALPWTGSKYVTVHRPVFTFQITWLTKACQSSVVLFLASQRRRTEVHL